MSTIYNQFQPYDDMIYNNGLTIRPEDLRSYQSTFIDYVTLLGLPVVPDMSIPISIEDLRSYIDHVVSKKKKLRDPIIEQVLLDYFKPLSTTVSTSKIDLYKSKISTSYDIVSSDLQSALDTAYRRQDRKTVGELSAYLDDPDMTYISEIKYLLHKYDTGQDYLELIWQDLGRNYEHIRLASEIINKKIHSGEYIKMPSLKYAWDMLDKSYHKKVDKDGNILASKMVVLDGETGGGKTAMAIAFAKEKTGKDPIVIACNPATSPAELVWAKEIVVWYDEHTKTAVPVTKMVVQWFQKAAKEGRMVILDEFTHLNDELKSVVNKYLDLLNKKWHKVEIEWNGGEIYAVSQEYFVIWTRNIWEQYSTGYEIDPSWVNRIQEVELPVLSTRDMYYFVVSSMWTRDKIIWPSDMSTTIAGMIDMKRKLEQQLIDNKYQDNKTAKEWVYTLPVFSNRVMIDILDYAKHDQYTTIQDWIYKTLINRSNISTTHKVYLFALAKECGLYKDIKIDLHPTSDIDRYINMSTDARWYWSDIQGMLSDLHPHDSVKQYNKVLLLRDAYPQLKQSSDPHWQDIFVSNRIEELFVDKDNFGWSADISMLDKIDIQSDTDYIHHAPTHIQEYYNTLDDQTKERVRDHVEYTAEGIDFRVNIDWVDAIIPFHYNNATHEDVTEDWKELVKTTTVNVDWNDIKETYFNWNWLNSKYNLTNISGNKSSVPTDLWWHIPTDTTYEALLKSMPAWDYSSRSNWCKAGKQLAWLLGVQLTGRRRPTGGHSAVGYYGYLRSASAEDGGTSRALRCNEGTDAALDDCIRDNLFPVRLLRTPPHPA